MSQLLRPASVRGIVLYANRQLDRFWAGLADAADTGDAHSVHGLRVASRRLEACLNSWQAWVGRRCVRRAGRELKRVRQAFRGVRDLDVLLASLSEPAMAPSLPPEDKARLAEVLEHRRSRLLARAAGLSREPRLMRSLRVIREMTAEFEETAGEEPDEVTRELCRRFRRDVEPFVNGSVCPDGESNLHECRIACKRLRYRTQLFQEGACLDVAPVLDALTGMQRLLGRWHDHIVAGRTVGRLAIRRRFMAGETLRAALLLRYAAFRSEAAEDERHRVREQWDSAVAALSAVIAAVDAMMAPEATGTAPGLPASGGSDHD